MTFVQVSHKQEGGEAALKCNRAPGPNGPPTPIEPPFTARNGPNKNHQVKEEADTGAMLTELVVVDRAHFHNGTLFRIRTVFCRCALQPNCHLVAPSVSCCAGVIRGALWTLEGGLDPVTHLLYTIKCTGNRATQLN